MPGRHHGATGSGSALVKVVVLHSRSGDVTTSPAIAASVSRDWTSGRPDAYVRVRQGQGAEKGGAVTSSSNSGLVGRIVIDPRHEPIGRVVDVIFEDPDPGIAVVDPGLFRASRFVPMRRFGRTGDGRIVVPFEAERVRGAPKAPKEHIVTRELRDRLEDHYDIGD